MPWPETLKTDRLCQYAAEHGRLELLQRARAAGCPWESIVPLDAWESQRSHGSPYKDNKERRLSTVEQAASHGHLEVLDWAIQNGAPLGDCPGLTVAGKGQLEALQRLVRHGYSLDASLAEAAACHNQKDVLEWLAHRGVPLGQACAAAAYGGHFELMKWARLHGGHLDEDVALQCFVEGTPAPLHSHLYLYLCTSLPLHLHPPPPTQGSGMTSCGPSRRIAQQTRSCPSRWRKKATSRSCRRCSGTGYPLTVACRRWSLSPFLLTR